MAWWKKALIGVGIAIAVCVIVMLLFYNFISNLEFETLPQGQYNLTRVTQTDASGQETTLEEFADGEYYIVIDEEDTIFSYSGNYGIRPREGGYYYFLHGNEIIVFLPNDDGSVAYTGTTQENIIKISTTLNDVTTNCYYEFVSQSVTQ